MNYITEYWAKHIRHQALESGVFTPSEKAQIEGLILSNKVLDQYICELLDTFADEIRMADLNEEWGD